MILLQLVISILLIPAKILFSLIPKNKKMWIFGGRIGEQYADNARYLFEYISDNTGHTAIWCTKNKKIYNRIKKEGRKACYFYSPTGIWYSIRSYYVVFCIAYNDVSFLTLLFSISGKIINLWHGSPMKKLAVKRSSTSSFIRLILITFLGREHDIIVSSTPEITKVLSHYFSPQENTFLETAYPRNDGLKNSENHMYLEQVKKSTGFTKVITFLPTFREYTFNDPEFNLLEKYGFNESKVTQLLKEQNAILILKLHPWDIKRSRNVLGDIARSNRIFIPEEKDIDEDIYPLLAHTDILITDYSGLFFDFTILNRPMIFSSFDIDQYIEQDRGFYFDYKKIIPGPMTKDWNDIMKQIRNSEKSDIQYKEKRSYINNTFNNFYGKINCERTFLDILNVTNV